MLRAAKRKRNSDHIWVSVAVALTTQCAYCIDAHVKNAVQAGATREEIAETVFITAALRAGGAVGNGLLAMRLFEEATATPGGN